VGVSAAVLSENGQRTEPARCYLGGERRQLGVGDKSFSIWQDAQHALPVATDRKKEQSPARWRTTMPTTLESIVTKYLRSGSPAQRTREEYATTLRKWSRWSGRVSLECLGRKEIREFLDWVHEGSASRQGSNPGRTANKARSHLRAVLSWAWEHDLVDALPRFPRLKPQRDVAGRHYLTKPEINALYFATHRMTRPRGWNHPWPVGCYWRCALVVFFNYGVQGPCPRLQGSMDGVA